MWSTSATRHHAAEGIAELAHHGAAAVLVHRQDADAAGVLHHLAPGELPVAELHPIQAYPDDDALIFLLAVDALLGEVHGRPPPFSLCIMKMIYIISVQSEYSIAFPELPYFFRRKGTKKVVKCMLNLTFYFIFVSSR